MAKVLRKLQVDEVSLVDKGAGEGVRVALFKRAEPTPTKVEKMTLEEAMAGLSPEAKAVLDAHLQELQAKAEQPAPPPAPAPAPEEKPGDEVAKALAALPESVRKVLDEQREELAKVNAEKEAVEKANREMADANRLRECVAKADTMKHVPGLSVQQLGGLLKRASEKLAAEDYTAFEKSLQSASAVVAKSQFYGHEIGGAGADVDSPRGRLEGIAKSLREQNPKMTKQQATMKAAELNPELYSLVQADGGKR